MKKLFILSSLLLCLIASPHIRSAQQAGNQEKKYRLITLSQAYIIAESNIKDEQVAASANSLSLNLSLQSNSLLDKNKLKSAIQEDSKKNNRDIIVLRTKYTTKLVTPDDKSAYLLGYHEFCTTTEKETFLNNPDKYLTGDNFGEDVVGSDTSNLRWRVGTAPPKQEEIDEQNEVTPEPVPVPVQPASISQNDADTDFVDDDSDSGSSNKFGTGTILLIVGSVVGGIVIVTIIFSKLKENKNKKKTKRKKRR